MLQNIIHDHRVLEYLGWCEYDTKLLLVHCSLPTSYKQITTYNQLQSWVETLPFTLGCAISIQIQFNGTLRSSLYLTDSLNIGDKVLTHFVLKLNNGLSVTDGIALLPSVFVCLKLSKLINPDFWKCYWFGPNCTRVQSITLIKEWKKSAHPSH